MASEDLFRPFGRLLAELGSGGGPMGNPGKFVIFCTSVDMFLGLAGDEIAQVPVPGWKQNCHSGC
jgi:hypothetical protein